MLFTPHINCCYFLTFQIQNLLQYRFPVTVKFQLPYCLSSLTLKAVSPPLDSITALHFRPVFCFIQTHNCHEPLQNASMDSVECQPVHSTPGLFCSNQSASLCCAIDWNSREGLIVNEEVNFSWDLVDGYFYLKMWGGTPHRIF